MVPRRHQAAAVLMGVLLSAASPGQAAPTMSGQIEVTGAYRYVFHDPETASEALNTACREAWRLAVIESPLYREQTASTTDAALLRDVADDLVTNHLSDKQILEQTERGKTVSCRVRGILAANSATTIRTQLAGGTPPEGVEQNRTLRIVSAKEQSGYLFIEFEALRRLDWLNTAYQGSLGEGADIMVDFSDESGGLIRSERHPARHSGGNQDVMSPGMHGILKVAKPLGAKSYRVWVVK